MTSVHYFSNISSTHHRCIPCDLFSAAVFLFSLEFKKTRYWIIVQSHHFIFPQDLKSDLARKSLVLSFINKWFVPVYIKWSFKQSLEKLMKEKTSSIEKGKITLNKSWTNALFYNQYLRSCSCQSSRLLKQDIIPVLHQMSSVLK